MDLKKIISQDESETVEFKKSLSESKEIIKTISAFANTKGGKIFIGISNSGKVLSVEIGKDTTERLVNQITQSTDPKVHPHITVEKIDEMQIIIVKIKESSDHLVLAFGRPYKRVGKSTLRMSKDEYERIILEKHKDRLQFDTQIYLKTTIKDINKERLRWFLRKAKEERNYDIDPETPLREALNRLNLIKDKNLTNTAILLFIFFDANRRYDRWEYPLRAIEEVLNNALAHRDYFSNAEIQLSIYDDRIEVWNPGRLPSQLRIEDLKKPHPSVPYNPLIFRQFYRVGFVELGPQVEN